MDLKIEKEELLGRLFRVGIRRDTRKYLSETEEVLENYAQTGLLREIDRDEFLMGVYKLWASRGKNRTVRGIEHRARQLGVKSVYHRLTGRLAKTKKIYTILLRWFLLEWTEENSHHIPHPTLGTEEKIHALAETIFQKETWLETETRRIKEEGLNAEDLEYLQTVQKILQRPIHIHEIRLILLVRH